MKLLWLLLLSFNASAADLIFCEGAYALCAASGATPTGNAMSIGGRKFLEGMAVSPVIVGVSVGNGALMKAAARLLKARSGHCLAQSQASRKHRHGR